jgi:hypothetical protein
VGPGNSTSISAFNCTWNAICTCWGVRVLRSLCLATRISKLEEFEQMTRLWGAWRLHGAFVGMARHAPIAFWEYHVNMLLLKIPLIARHAPIAFWEYHVHMLLLKIPLIGRSLANAISSKADGSAPRHARLWSEAKDRVLPRFAIHLIHPFSSALCW